MTSTNIQKQVKILQDATSRNYSLICRGMAKYRMILRKKNFQMIYSDLKKMKKGIQIGGYIKLTQEHKHKTLTLKMNQTLKATHRNFLVH